jgi:putative PIG3 family NAD(P)H quinone oxidoreductase
MRAIAISQPGGPDVLVPVETDVPEPGQHEVLVRVTAAGVNRPDILQREGRYPVPADASPFPGLEVAGEIVETGDAVDEWRRGDRIMALAHGGGYAEYCRVHAQHCLEVPDALTDIEAAGVPETGFTVCYNVFMRAALRDGETLLVHGGSSGIGSMAIQLARALGSRVITTAGTDEKCRFAESLGADLALNYRTTDWESAIREHLSGNRVDVVLDMVAGDYVQKNLSLMARDGRYALIAFLRGDTAEISLRPIVGRRIVLTGSTLRPQTIEEKALIREKFRQMALPLLASGAVKPPIHEVYPLEEARAAHECMESGRHMGKLILQTHRRSGRTD